MLETEMKWTKIWIGLGDRVNHRERGEGRVVAKNVVSKNICVWFFDGEPVWFSPEEANRCLRVVIRTAEGVFHFPLDLRIPPETPKPPVLWQRELIIWTLQNPPPGVVNPASSFSWRNKGGYNGFLGAARRLFGSWPGAVLAAGLTPCQPEGKKHPHYNINKARREDPFFIFLGTLTSEKVKEWIDSLSIPARDKEILWRWSRGESLATIGTVLGVSKQAVHLHLLNLKTTFFARAPLS